MKSIQEIVDILNVLAKTETNKFKKKAFYNASMSLSTNMKLTDTIEDASEIENLPSIGKGILHRVEQILEEIIIIPPNELLEVHGIGPAKARLLAQEYGITTIEELKMNQDLLNKKQKFGLKYVKSTMQRIPRKEMLQHNNYIKKTIRNIYPGLQIEITGSYRRKQEDSGDIDVLIKNNGEIELKDIVNTLTKKEYLLKDYFAFGDSKFLGLAKHKSFENIRRIDILLIDEDEFPFALLYFTGSKNFNIRCRNAALKKGYTLNEHGIFNLKNYENVPNLLTEKEVLAFIDIPYISPEKR